MVAMAAVLFYRLAFRVLVHLLPLLLAVTHCQVVDQVYIGTGTNGSYEIPSKDNPTSHCSLSESDGQSINDTVNYNERSRNTSNYSNARNCAAPAEENEVVILGGLFAIHQSDNQNQCLHDKIYPIIMQDVEAMVLAVDKINRDESLLPGITLVYEIRDTCMLPSHALEQTVLSLFKPERGLQNNTGYTVSGVVGTSFSSVSITVANIMHAFKIPQISYSATSKELNDLSLFNYFFRLVPPDTQQAQAMVSIIGHFKWKFILGIYLDNKYGFEAIESLYNLITYNKVLGDDVCGAEWIDIKPSATAKDYDNVVTTMNREWIANATVVVLFCHQQQAEALFDAILRKRAIDPEFAMKNFTWIGSDSWGMSVSPKYYDLVHGMLTTVPKVQLSKEFDEYFLSLHPSNNSANPWFNEYWEEIFNCSLGNRKDVPECDLDNQIQSKENTGYSQNNFLPFVLDSVYAFAHAIHNMQQQHCPEHKGLCPGILDIQELRSTLKGELLVQYVRNVSFNGTSADRIHFNKNQYYYSGYDIFNLQMDSSGQFSYVKVGEWDNLTESRDEPLVIYGNIQWSSSLNGSDVPESVCSYPCAYGEHVNARVFKSSCCWGCVPCEGSQQISDRTTCRECEQGLVPNEERSECIAIQPNFLKWSNPFSIIMIILAILGLILTTLVGMVFIFYHKHHLIKASSRELTAVLLIGIMLCYLMPFFYIPKPSPVFCGIQRFGFGLCFSLCFSALLIKTNRIHRIFNRNPASVKPIPLVSPLSQLFFTALLASVQVIIIVVWLVAEPPTTKITYNNKLNAILTCGVNPYIGLSVSLAYSALLLVITTYFSIRTRKVPENFNEAKFINLNMYTLCILWLAFIPSYFITAALNTNYHTSILLLAVILSGTVILFSLLVPRVYFLFVKKKKEASVKYQTSTRSTSSTTTACNRVHFDSSCTTPVVNSPSDRLHYSPFLLQANVKHDQLNDNIDSSKKVDLSTSTIPEGSSDGIELINEKHRERKVTLDIKSKNQDDSFGANDLADHNKGEESNDRSQMEASTNNQIDLSNDSADQVDPNHAGEMSSVKECSTDQSDQVKNGDMKEH